MAIKLGEGEITACCPNHFAPWWVPAWMPDACCHAKNMAASHRICKGDRDKWMAAVVPTSPIYLRFSLKTNTAHRCPPPQTHEDLPTKWLKKYNRTYNIALK